MVLPFLPSLSLFQSLCSSPLFVVGGGGSYFPSNIKPPYRQAHGPPSRGAGWTCCIGCGPFPSCSWTDRIYFSQNDVHSSQNAFLLSGLWFQQTRPQSSSMIVPECIFSLDVLIDVIWGSLWFRPHPSNYFRNSHVFISDSDRSNLKTVLMFCVFFSPPNIFWLFRHM